MIAIYVAHHFGPTITNTNTWSNPLVLSMLKPQDRRFAEQAVLDHPHPTEHEIQEAEAALKPYVAAAQPLGFLQKRWFPLAAFGACLVIYVALPALVCALLFRGGLVLWALGVAMVRSDGVRASRVRVFWRILVAWSPLLLAPLVLGGLTVAFSALTALLLLALLILGLTVGFGLLPHRSLPDRIAGTWLVPR